MTATNTLDKHACYAAFKAHDARFDGRLFVCVASTGIYCRPICRVKMPKAANCTFTTSAAAAEAGGFRPCLRCRPELAPGMAPADAAGNLARRAALAIEEGRGITGLAAYLEVSDRHLRRVFMSEYGVSPVRYLQTRRLLLAKSLLADTRLPITEIAFAAGFGSVRRFNALLQKHYRMPPSALRNKTNASSDGLTLMLGYRPPYAWDKMLAFLAARTISGVENVQDNTYQRTIAMPHNNKTIMGWLSVRHVPQKNALAVTVAPTLVPVLPALLQRVRNMFDLNCDPLGIYATLSAMNRFRPDICQPGTRLPGCFDGFEMAVRAVLGQQITVKAARTLTERLAQTRGTPVVTPFAELTHTFPSAQTICELPGSIEAHLGKLGIIRSRARSIAALAQAIVKREITLSPSADISQQTQRLLALPGFGPWTVNYLAMRALSWPDAFPHSDYGVKKAMDMSEPRQILEQAEAWRPWRAYATINLWNSLA